MTFPRVSGIRLINEEPARMVSIVGVLYFSAAFLLINGFRMENHTGCLNEAPSHDIYQVAESEAGNYPTL